MITGVPCQVITIDQMPEEYENIRIENMNNNKLWFLRFFQFEIRFSSNIVFTIHNEFAAR